MNEYLVTGEIHLKIQHRVQLEDDENPDTFVDEIAASDLMDGIQDAEYDLQISPA